ncbi:MAG: DUF2877 domain-containing protein [Tyzzerella sp.]|nr:DUF2877 domain-containing protein [Tyzzerella sp.]
MENERRTYGDETMFEVTPIEMNLASEWNQDEISWGTLHSKFDRVQNFRFSIKGEARLLTIMREGNILLPDSIILRREDYERLKKQDEFRAVKSKDYMQIKDIKIALSNISSCSLLNISLENFNKEQFEQKKKQIETFIGYSGKKSDFERLPERYGVALSTFVEGVLDSNLSAVESSFQTLIGAGRGLTPAADDAIVGTLAGCLLGLALHKKQDTYFARVERILSYLIGEKQTTEISCKYLKCACRGEFAEILCRLIQILAGDYEADLVKVLEKIKEVGHSSGMDMLYGLEKALDCIL